jgi:RHS repeat-associated protein
LTPQLTETEVQAYFIHTDARMAPVMLTESTGAVAWRAEYDPFGGAFVLDGTLSGETVEMNLRLPGQYFDAESGLHYNWHRYYDPELGRYISTDPKSSELKKQLLAQIQPAKGDFKTVQILEREGNLFAYSGNNPMRYFDPYGLWAIGGGIEGAIVLPFIGGVYGINLEYTSCDGLHLYGYYTPNDSPPFGLLVGVTPSVNFASGDGSWEGPFHNLVGSWDKLGFGLFTTDPFWGGSGGPGYSGVQVGASWSPPGLAYAKTNYVKLY